MTTHPHTNGAHPPVRALCPPPLPREVALAELDAWDTALADLDQALRDAATARRDLAAATTQAEVLEASALLTVEGKNEAERKARLVLALRESAAYQLATADAQEARERLADAERRIVTRKERCRLLRAAVLLAAGASDA